MLISPTKDDEWHNADDMSLTAEGFNTIMSAKIAVDSDPQCTNKVSCADILAIAARDAVVLVNIPKKRKTINSSYILQGRKLRQLMFSFIIIDILIVSTDRWTSIQSGAWKT